MMVEGRTEEELPEQVRRAGGRKGRREDSVDLLLLFGSNNRFSLSPLPPSLHPSPVAGHGAIVKAGPEQSRAFKVLKEEGGRDGGREGESAGGVEGGRK